MKSSLLHLITQRREAALSDARRIQEQALMYQDLNELTARIVEKYRLDVPTFEPPAVDGPRTVQLSAEQTRSMPGIFAIAPFARPGGYPGVQMRVIVPFKGTPELFDYMPSHFNTSPPSAELDASRRQLVFTDTFLESQYNPGHYMSTVKGKIEPFRWWLEQVDQEVRPFNAALPDTVLNLLVEQRRRIVETLVQAEAAGVRSTFSPSQAARSLTLGQDTSALQLSPMRLPTRMTSTLLPREDYVQILEAIDRFARRLERSNTIVRELGEEALRDVLIAALNMIFPNRVTGETFNRRGKTDILVQQNDEVAFLGECKFWGGEKLFLETVEQLLTYLTSRDLLTAVIIFNRNKAVTAVVDRVAETIRAHPLFDQDLEVNLERRTLRFKFKHPRDERLRMDLAVLIYDL